MFHDLVTDYLSTKQGQSIHGSRVIPVESHPIKCIVNQLEWDSNWFSRLLWNKKIVAYSTSLKSTLILYSLLLLGFSTDFFISCFWLNVSFYLWSLTCIFMLDQSYPEWFTTLILTEVENKLWRSQFRAAAHTLLT